MKNNLVAGSGTALIFTKVSAHIDSARFNIMRSVDTEMVKAYWLIGREIIEEEQNGLTRAKYGSYLLTELSARLNDKYGKGFGVETLKRIRQFYLVFKDVPPIGYAVRTQSKTLNSSLGWSHYRVLMRINNINARSFYEIEVVNNNWSSRELERQVNSLLFERLSKSKDKEGLMKLAANGQEIINPIDAIKDPMILEFLSIPESNRLVESELEEALINNLQQFLLELGKGFAFVARQKRLTLDGDHFYTDLVFYSIPLKAYLIIDLKTRKLSHADLGQMQLYVNYFDREIKVEGDNPTIGLVLCTDKNNTMVKYMLGDNGKQIFASRYQFHLPSEEDLEQELQREIAQLDQNLNYDK